MPCGLTTRTVGFAGFGVFFADFLADGLFAGFTFLATTVLT